MICPILNRKVVDITITMEPGESAFEDLTTTVATEVEIPIYLCSKVPGVISYEPQDIDYSLVPITMWQLSKSDITDWLIAMGFQINSDIVVVPLLRNDVSEVQHNIVSCFWPESTLYWERLFSSDFTDTLNNFLTFTYSNPQDNCAQCHWISTTVSSITPGEFSEFYSSPRVPVMITRIRSSTPKNIPFADDSEESLQAEDYFLGKVLDGEGVYEEGAPNIVPGEKVTLFWNMKLPWGADQELVNSEWFHTPLFTGGYITGKEFNVFFPEEVLYTVECQGVTLENVRPSDFSPYFEHDINDWVYLLKLDSVQPVTFSGYDEFAAANADWSLLHNSDNPITYTDSLLDTLQTVNDQVNFSNDYQFDEDQYGKLDKWAFMDPGDTGDCEDFALTKAKALLQKGISRDALHIEAGVNSDGEWHAWLEVSTDKGDYALNNDGGPVVKNSSLGFGRRQRLVGGEWIIPLSEYSSADGEITADSKVVIAPVYFENGPTFDYFQTKYCSLSQNFEETFDLGCYEGVITNVYEDSNFADVDVDIQITGKPVKTQSFTSVPIFFHCENQGKEYNVNKGHRAFAVAQKVLVLNESGKKEGFSSNDFSIIGHAERLVSCGGGQVMFESRPNISESEYTSTSLVHFSGSYDELDMSTSIDDWNKPARLSTLQLVSGGVSVSSTVDAPDNVEILSLRWCHGEAQYMALYCYGPGYGGGEYWPEYTSGGTRKYLGLINPSTGNLGSSLYWDVNEDDAVFICHSVKENGVEYYLLARHATSGSGHWSVPDMKWVSYSEGTWEHLNTVSGFSWNCYGESSFVFLNTTSTDLATILASVIHIGTSDLRISYHDFYPNIDDVHMAIAGDHLVWAITGYWDTHEGGVPGSTRGEIIKAPLSDLTDQTVIFEWGHGQSLEGNEVVWEWCSSLCYDEDYQELIVFFHSKDHYVKAVDPYYWHCSKLQGEAYPDLVTDDVLKPLDKTFTVVEAVDFEVDDNFPNRIPNCKIYEPTTWVAEEGGNIFRLQCIEKLFPLEWDVDGVPTTTGEPFPGCLTAVDFVPPVINEDLPSWRIFETSREGLCRVGDKEHPYTIQNQEEAEAKVEEPLEEACIGDWYYTKDGNLPPIPFAKRLVLTMSGSIVTSDLTEEEDSFYVPNHYDPVYPRLVNAKVANK